MTIKLLNWSDEVTEVEVGSLDSISSMEIEIWSGDEILNVLYKDGSIKVFDSDRTRIVDFFDDKYELYVWDDPDNSLLNDEKWLNRKTSYDHSRQY